MSQSMRFDEQVAIVTGAGGGLGRSIAQELARRGAAVLVNDYGGDTQGGGANAARAEQAAAEIRSVGGRAVADATPVGTPAAARSIASHALDAFGRIDILVNNAGIARPLPLEELTDEDVELSLRTNLLGAHALLRAVWRTMCAQRYGRILSVSSNAALGIGHNSTYATSKAGLIGMTLDAACEGRAHGIHVNAVMPVAYTRMVAAIPDEAFVAWFREHMAPEKAAAAISYFLSRESQVTGHILSTGGGRLARVVFAGNPGVLGAVDAEAVQSQLAEALGVSSIRALDSSFDELGLYTAAFPFRGDGAGPTLDQQVVVGASRAHDSSA